MSAVILRDLEDPAICRALADEAWQLMEALHPICRSITGRGVRDTLDIVGGHIPLEISEVASGTPVFDWEVPNEWNVREAWIDDPGGRRIVDLRDHPLHLVSYSAPVQATVGLAQLRAHLHTLPEHPDWIPYRTSYYKQDWGFCLTHKALASLQDGQYRVLIDSTLEPGHLTYAECVIRGASDEEFLISTHICHPGLCNDNLTGIALATLLARELARSEPRLTYRFVFAPGTIGAITWLARNEQNLQRVRHGLVIGLLGDRGPLTYKRSRQSRADIDRIAASVLEGLSARARLVDFSPYGYDERQFCSPGFDLPVGRLTRTPHNEYPQYHSSADDFSIIDRDCLAESALACASILRIADRNERYINLNPKCEPRLGKRGLYRHTGGSHPGEFEHALLWVLNQSDGSSSLLDVADRSGLSFAVLAEAADALQRVSLLRPVPRAAGRGEGT